MIAMAQARQQDHWNHTASLMALLANINRDPKRGRALTPADFHPLQNVRRQTQTEKPLKGQIGMLKAVFVDQRGNRT